MSKVNLVFMNGERIGTCGPMKKDCKLWVRDHVLSTHMGEWIRDTKNTVRYETTIGRTYTFVRVFRLV